MKLGVGRGEFGCRNCPCLGARRSRPQSTQLCCLRLPAVPPERPAESSTNGGAVASGDGGGSRGSSRAKALGAEAEAEGEEGEEPEDTQAKRRPKGRVHETESGKPHAQGDPVRAGRGRAG